MTLVAWYNFNDQTTADISGNGNDPTAESVSIIKTARNKLDGYYLSFFTGSNYMTLPSGIPDTTGDFSLSFIMGNEFANTPDGFVFDFDNFKIENTGTTGDELTITVTNDAATDYTIVTAIAASLIAGAFFHYMIVWDVSAKTLYLYVNNSLVDSVTASGNFTNAAAHFHIGKDDAASDYASFTLLDQVRIFDTAFDSTKRTLEYDFLYTKKMWYKFNGDVTDASGWGNDATAFNTPIYITGRKEQGIQFNGTNQYLITPNNALPGLYNQFLSISIYVYLNDLDSDQMIIDNGYLNNGWALRYTATGNKFYWSFENEANTETQVVISQNITTSQWFHCIMLWNNETKTVLVYNDKTLISQTILSGNYNILQEIVTNIGRKSSGSEYFDGKLDDLRAGNILYSEFNIHQIINWNPTNLFQKLHLWYKFSQDGRNCTFNTNHLNDIGTPTYSKDTSKIRNGYGYDFSSSNYFENLTMDLQNPFTDTFTVTFSAWISTKFFLMDVNENYFYIDFSNTDNFLDFYVLSKNSGSSLARFTHTFTLNTRVHYRIEVDIPNSQASLYVDNTFVQTVSFAVDIRAPFEEEEMTVGGAAASAVGVMDDLKLYFGTLTTAEAKRDYRKSFEAYDIRVNDISVASSIISGTYTNSINFLTGLLKVDIADKSGYIGDLIDNGNDIKIYQKGNIVWRGYIEEPAFGKNKIIMITARDYYNILFNRTYTFDYTGSADTRVNIIGDIITDQLGAGNGDIYFDNSGVETITSETIEPIYIESNIANIFLGFAQKEKAAVFLGLTSSLPIPVKYIPKGFESSGVVLDWDTRSNNVNSKLIGWNFSNDAKPLQNQVTLFSPASEAESTTFIYMDTTKKYGIKTAKPIVDENALTENFRKQRLFEEQEKWKKEIKTGTLLAKSYWTLQAGKTLELSIDELNYDKRSFLIYQATHDMKTKKATLKVADLTSGQSEVIQSLVKNQSSANVRDAEVNSTNTKFYIAEFEIEMRFYIQVSETGIGIILEDTQMITTRAGKDIIANLVTGSGTALDNTNAHLAFGDGTDDLGEASTTLGNEVGTRDQVDSAPSNIGSGIREFIFTITNTQLTSGTIKEWTIANASSGSTLFGVLNTTPITKSSGVDLNIIVRMEVV